MIQALQEFALLLLLRPGTALRIAWWRIVGFRVRARAQFREAAATLPFAYGHWLRRCARADRAALATGGGPALTVHIHHDAESEGNALTRAIMSVLRQSWPHWRLVITTSGATMPRLPANPGLTVLGGTFASYGEGLAAAFDVAESDYFVPLGAGCFLPRAALAAYAAHLGAVETPAQPILYGDQDEADPRGRRSNPWFKPGWDPEMFLSQDYVSASCAIPVAAARAVGVDKTIGTDAVYDLVLRMTLEGARSVEHLCRVTASTPRDHWRRLAKARLAIARKRLSGQGADVEACPFGGAYIRWPLPDVLPLVSIIVPTRDKVDLLRTCVEGVLARTSYPNFEIVIADNDSVESTTRDFLQAIVADPRVRVIDWPHAFNYSAINNAAVREARGAFLCLLNNDIEILDGAWLSELMRYAVRPNAGAVGARLLYPDHSIQHAGVVVGMGNAAGHAHRGLGEGEPGYFAHALLAHRATAVTAACLVVRRDRFEAVGGLDEQRLRVAYNDVDLCLKLRRAGLDNYYVPSAVLIHHESKSRGLDMAAEHRDRYNAELATLQARWATETWLDPTHHPALDRGSETYRPIFIFCS